MDEIKVQPPEVNIMGPEGEALHLQLRIFASEEEYEASIAEELARFGIAEDDAPVGGECEGKAAEP